MLGPSKAEVWQIDLGGAQGHEQKKIRPCVIWRDLDHMGMAIVIPFTGSIKKENALHTCSIFPNSTNGLEKESIALLFQITTADKKRLKKKLGLLEEKDVQRIGHQLKDLLRL